jgi:hypothetical protein
MEDRKMSRIRWKRDDKGRPRRMPASYIMQNDPHAAQAFTIMRQRGMSRREATDRIERCFRQAFIEALISDDDPPKDRRPECWFMLVEGMPLERIFPDLPVRPAVN